MSWISVHEQVIGAKLRNFAKKLGRPRNEALGVLVRVWLCGIRDADADGLMKSAANDAAEIVTGSDWMDFQNGRLCIRNWKAWRKQLDEAVNIRARDDERKARNRKAPERQETSPDSPPEVRPQTEGFAASANAGAANPGKKSKNDYPTGFEEFWTAYPRKMGKGEAYAKYMARLRDGWSPAELLEAAKAYAAEARRLRTEERYIKRAATFLSEKTPFTDYLPRRGAAPPESGAYQTESAGDASPFAEWE